MEHGFEIVDSSSDIGNGLTTDCPALLDFRAAAAEGKVDILLLHSLTRLGQDTGGATKYWQLLHDFSVSVHTADCE